ncbi:MAG: type IX secretion system membrane protein PorP/SprF, partial [Saprospiraceae bacterium]
LGIADIYSGGVTYRTAKSNDALGESIDILFGARITPQWFVGLSYDIGLNQIRRASNGSIEVMLRYSLIAPQSADFSNPRYF